ncbi:MAG: OB-fold nucleic acid binding domain-containing protein, partial [Patescibacteria group bacterium]
MSAFEDIKNERIKKLNLLKEKGIEPFPVSTDIDLSVADVLADFENLLEKGKEIKIAGRIMAVRTHGGSVFFDLNDGGGKIQIYLKKDEM